MEDFVRRQNIARYERLLAEAADPETRRTLLKLLAEARRGIASGDGKEGKPDAAETS